MIHKKEDFEKMRVAGQLAASVLDYITDYVKEGVSTNHLNDLCHEFIVKNNAIPAPLNYKGFPKSICTSINHVVCHGIPNDKILKNGDILNIDVTVIVEGWYGDTSRMFFIGNPSIKAKKLVDVTYNAMMLGIGQIKPGSRLGDIGHAIQSYVEQNHFSVVRDFCGHGIGRVFHDDPSILHYGKKNTGAVLESGMFFTVEPMINAGSWEVLISNIDKWTVTTKDKALSAQFEHTIGVTQDGVEIFTLSPKGYHRPPYNH